MQVDILVDDTIEALERLSDPGRREYAPKYYPTSMAVIGVTNPDMKKVVTSLRGRLKTATAEEYLIICKELVSKGIFECQQVAYSLLDKNRKLIPSLGLKDLDDLGQGLDNWISVDTFSAFISGIAWREGSLSDEIILGWLQSPDRWRRRVAVVSTIPLHQKARGGKGDPEKTIMICERIISDKDDMVQKALSWVLRELSKRDKVPVEDFIEKHWEKLSGRVKREVTTKLTTGRKK